MDLQNFLEKNIEGMYEVYDRFTFDNLFRVLLNEGFEPEDALNFILCNCSLSAIVFEKRVYNKYYLSISAEDTISPDLAALRNLYLFEIAASRY